MKLVSKKTTYELTPEDIKNLIADSLREDSKNVEVHFVIEEVGGDPLDRYRGTDQVTKINVTVNKT